MFKWARSLQLVKETSGGSFRRTYSQLIPLSGVAGPPSYIDGHGSSLGRLAGLYGYSAERA
jgi:hypothetical protein